MVKRTMDGGGIKEGRGEVVRVWTFRHDIYTFRQFCARLEFEEAAILLSEANC